MQILPARLADDLSVFVDQHAAQKGRVDARRHLQPLERRIALRARRVLRGDGPALYRIDQRDIGIEAFGDVALAVQAEALRRVQLVTRAMWL